MEKKIIAYVFILALLVSCRSKQNEFDASGSFEADEVIVSSLANGRILSLNLDEGTLLEKDSIVGLVDATGLDLQKEEVEASIKSLQMQTQSVTEQVKLLQDQLGVQQSQLDNMEKERQRVENLVKLDAATGKQLDDIHSQIAVIKKQMAVTRQQIQVQKDNTATRNRGILSQSEPMKKRISQIEDQLKKTAIRNPIKGTVLTQYAEAGEVTTMGKAIYKIADLSDLYLRAYISGTQLAQAKLGQLVKLRVDDGKDKYREYNGTITWISDKAEFTPKTIQTKEERASLVYAIKVKVKNDGTLKIGMYGEVKF
ncbi:MAG: HlyD family efflux transporter periplasmic adaptor subunit [Chitinophagaceae bacterium]|nr:HlyD family efflux transporter periplasmic adaptor subunit [Chitinophagaceae bacterium]